MSESERISLIRDSLFARLKQGEIGPRTAEAEAAALGVGSLETEPDPADYDPMEKLAWTLAMAITWIVFRDHNQVRESDNDYRTGCYRLMFQGWFDEENQQFKNSWALDRPLPLTIDSLMLEMLDRCDDIRAAKSELWAALYDGKATAQGVRVADGAIVDIPAGEWGELMAHSDHRGQYLAHEAFGCDYRRVNISRASILTLWPAAVAQTITPGVPAHVVAAEASDQDATAEISRVGSPSSATGSRAKLGPGRRALHSVSEKQKKALECELQGTKAAAVISGRIKWNQSAKVVADKAGVKERTVQDWRNDDRYIAGAMERLRG